MFQKSKKNNVKLAFVFVVSLVLILSILCQHRTEAMKRIKKYISNKNLYRTDQDGTILFINDGKKLIVKKE